VPWKFPTNTSLRAPLAFDVVTWEMLQPCTCRFGEVQGEVAYDELITVRAVGLPGDSPMFGVGN
jgi:hypothetical protein